MRKLVYRRIFLPAIALILLTMSVPLTLQVSAAGDTEETLFQDDFEGAVSGAWNPASGDWRITAGESSELFSDDFVNESAAGWTNNSGAWSFVQSGGSNAYKQSNSNGASELLAGDDSWTDYTFEADIKLLSGAGAMMDFRYQDNQHFYYLYMGENYIRLMKQNGSNQKWLKAYDGPALDTADFVTIKVEAIGNQFNIYRNGELVLTVIDDNSYYAHGEIGLATWATAAEFKNVTVQDALANQVYLQNDPNGGITYAGESAWTNYALQADIRPIATEQSATIGISLRQQDDGSRYSMQYIAADASSGTVQISKTAGGETTILAEAPYSMKSGSFYKWKGIAAGQALELHINGVKLLSAEDSSLAAGKIALHTNKATASFDNVIVTKAVAPVISDGNTTYYVSASSGSDTNDGLSETTAWKTLNKVNASTFGAGDSILLKAGDRWNEPLNLKGSGTEELPIKVASYGTGSKPVIAWNAPGGGVVSGDNLSHWIIQNLAVEIIPSSKQSWSNITAGILIRYDNSKLHQNVRIDGNEVYSSTYDSNTNGIVISALVPGTDYREVVRDLVISGNTVHDAGWYGITTTGWDIAKNEELRSQLLYGNVRVAGNHVYNMASQGIVIQNAHNSSIDRNVVHDGGLGDDTWGPGGLWFIASRDSVIKFNEIYNMKDANSGFDGAGLNIDWYCDNITVQYNYSHHNKGNGITTMSNRGAKILNNKVQGNKGEQTNGRGQIALGNFTGRPDLSTGLHDVEVAHNTIIVDVNNTAAVNSAANPYGTWTGNAIHSNHIVMTPGRQNTSVFSVGNDTHIDRIDQNIVYSEQAAFRGTFKGAAYSSLTDWQAGTGYDQGTQVRLLPQNPALPAKVQNVAAISAGEVQLSWTAAQDPNNEIAHYNIYRSTTADFTPAYANMVGEAVSASFVDREDLQPNTTYYYKVEAESIDGNTGAASESAQVMTGAEVPATEKPKTVDFFSLRDGYELTLSALTVTPYITGIPDIAKVQLYVDEQLVQELTTPPYSYTVTGLSNGEHHLQYRVHDTSGAVTSSKEVKINKQTTALRSLFAPEKPAIDGKLNEWGAPDFHMNQTDQVKSIEPGFKERWSKKMLTASGYTKWDEENLYLALEVAEDQHSLAISDAADLWKGSSIQIAIDPDRGNAPGKKGYSEFAFGLTDDGKALAYRYNAISGRAPGLFTAGKIVIDRDEATKKTTYEIAIPWHELLPADVAVKDGSALGISVLANYSDGSFVNPEHGDARNGWIEYNSGIGAGKAPEQFGYFILHRQPFAVPVISGTAADRKIDLHWPAVTGAAGYIIKYGTASGTYTQTIQAGNTSKLALTGLTSGATYYIASAAYDSYGESSLSNELAITVPSDSSGSGSGWPGGIGTVVSPQTSTVKLKDGAAYVEMEENQAAVTVSLADLSKIGPYPLHVQQGNRSITISQEALDALKKQAGINAQADAVVEITIASAADAVMDSSKAQLTAAGDAGQFSVSLHTAGKGKFTAEQLPEGVTISFPFDDAKVDSELIGIYIYNAATKQWEYAGGNIDQEAKQVRLAIKQTGIYSVLEYKKSFTDVPSGHWAARTLQILAAKHIIQGATDSTFRPAGQTSRAEFVTMLANVLRLPAGGDVTFKDINKGAWYADAVAAAVQAGIVTGRTSAQFAPEEPITRAEMAVMIVRALKMDAGDHSALSQYKDADAIPAWASSAVAAATEASLMQGRGQQLFAPQQHAMRAEAAQLIFNLLRQLETTK
ncbi:S-layer homology domain-containing protein [Paenibacillus sp. GCM10027626]|uniref:S-layer homology domain-containing protein n=1 Tax=Paenibacillus sp. GCM10027626 TaxID=3273411 RepID=UPI00362F09DF